MRVFVLVLIAILLSSCGLLRDGTNAHIMISRADDAGLGSLLGLGGETCKMTHSDPVHVFTESEIAMFKERCPAEVSSESMLQELIKRQQADGQ